MRTKILSFILLAGLAGSALAQPTPPTPPTEPTPPTPPTPPAPPTPPPPTRPTAPPPTPVPVVVVEPPPKPEPIKKLAVGTEGFFQPGLLLQGWLITDTTSSTATPSTTLTTSTFRLRRAEITAKGEILPKRVAYKVMFDAAKVREFGTTTITDGTGMPVTVLQPVSKVAPMQDFYITFLSQYADVSVGQFKIPVSWEGFNSSAKIVFPERALVSNKFGDLRDLGIRAEKTFPKWGYVLGIYNGLGANNLDNNNQKDLSLRLEAYPVKGLTIAGVTYDSIGYRGRVGTKDRWELDARYEKDALLVQAEYIYARDILKYPDPTNAQGFYVLAGYTLKSPDFKGELQPIVRIGYLDTNTDAAVSGDAVTQYDVGLNYYMKGHEMKLQAAYTRFQFQETTVGGVVTMPAKPANNEMILAAQVWF